MSLFRAERPSVSRITLVQDVIPAKSVPGELQIRDGDLWNDSAQSALGLRMKGLTSYLMSAPAVNITPVTATNPSAAADLMTLALPAGYLNQVGKTLAFYANGNYTTAGGQTPTVNLTANLGSAAEISWTSGATNASVTASPWEVYGYITCASAGATGTVEAHGNLKITLGAGGAIATTSYLDINAAVSAAIDLTAAQTFKLQALMSSANAGNNVQQRMLVAYLIN